MNQRAPFLFLVGLLVVTGALSTAFRHQEYQVPLLPGEQQVVWQVEARIEFQASGDSAQAILTLPPRQSDFRFVSENTASAGYGFTLDNGTGQRRAHWSKRDAEGEQTLFYKVELVEDPGFHVRLAPPGNVHAPIWDDEFRTAARTVIGSVYPQSADALTLTDQIIRELNTTPRDQNVALLRDQYNLAPLLANILAEADVAARTVAVLELEDGRRRQSLTEYVQVWQDGWHLYDPRTGAVDDSERLLLWQASTPGVLEVIGGTDSQVTFSILSQARSSMDLANQSAASALFSLYTLPVGEQSMFQLIMLLPVGALVVVFMRTIVGIKTSGTFMPILIALAFLQTDLVPGVVSFLLVVAVGLVIRSYLSGLNLLLVARIATLVIVVIGIISVFSILSYRLGLIAGLTITFFPMIILAWTIERMSILWEEEGPREVVVQGGGSLLVAVLAFLLMDQDVTRHLAFNFPELHLIVLAVILVLGRYTGYRLSELGRFAPMAK